MPARKQGDNIDDKKCIYMTTFRKSQKVKNLRKDPKAALLIESGDAYQELKSLIIYTNVELIEEVEAVKDILEQIALQRGDMQENANEDIREGMLKTAEKRIGMKFKPKRIVSWDHSKLGGVY